MFNVFNGLLKSVKVSSNLTVPTIFDKTAIHSNNLVTCE
jgi:hypothetical protein